MGLRVRQLGGVLVECGEEGVVLDPTRNLHDYPAFVTHSHSDHAAAFKHPEVSKYSTCETRSILEAMRANRGGQWTRVSPGSTTRVGDFEVVALNSGHVLGSVQYLVHTPEGSVLYTGDLGTEPTFTMDPATPAECDLLVIESTFGAPMFRFPSREELAPMVYQWAVQSVLEGKVPVFKTDSIGNAQEVISLLNHYTNLPVVTHGSATKVTQVYRGWGYRLESVDSKSSEGRELLEGGQCAVVAPKGSRLRLDDAVEALASGWARLFNTRRTAFPLSDHADYRGLLKFISWCKPKRVLTFHGGSLTRDFHHHISKRLGVSASPLTSRAESVEGPIYSNEAKVMACARQLKEVLKMGYVYPHSWLAREMERKGFTAEETHSALDLLLVHGVVSDSSEGVQRVKL